MVSTQELTRLSLSQATCIGLLLKGSADAQERTDASLIYASSKETLNFTPNQLSPIHIVEGKSYPPTRGGAEPNRSRTPVIDAKQKPLMPCTAKRARALLTAGKAAAKQNKLDLFYIQLKTVKHPNNQLLVLGVDPGSQYEGYSAVGAKDTALNIMGEATTWVSKAVKTRRIMRRARRDRKTRHRKRKTDNHLANTKRIPPSTRACWNTKLRIINQLEKILPIKKIVVEDTKAVTHKNGKHWNSCFSPLEVGKRRFYSQINQKLITRSGTETKALRDSLDLKKLHSKNKKVFETHCVDAWCLAASVTGTQYPTIKALYYMVPLRFHRRQLHRLQPKKSGKRKPYGGTQSLSVKRGTLVKHPKYGLCYVGGHLKNRISLHNLKDGKRLTQKAKVKELKTLTHTSFRTRFLPCFKAGASSEAFR